MLRILTIMATIIAASVWIWPTVSQAEPEQNLILIVQKDASGSYLPGDMDGTWYFGALGFENFTSSDPESHTRWGTMSFSSVLSPDLDVAGYDFDSSVGGLPASYTLSDASFIVDRDGLVHIYPNPIVEGDQPKGYLSPSHQIMAMRHPAGGVPGVYDDIQIQIELALKQGGGLTNNSLSGTYHIRNMEAYDTSDSIRGAASYWGTFTFNGSGGYTYVAQGYNSDGTPEGSHSGGGTYSVNDDGSLSMTPEPGEPSLYGQLSSDGHVMFASIGFQKNAGYRHNGLLVGIKIPTRTFSNADLSGEYFYVQLGIDDIKEINGSRDGSVAWGLISFDGAGLFTLQVYTFDAASNADQVTSSGNYSVTGNGDVELTFTQVGGQMAGHVGRGQISDNGQFIALSGEPASQTPAPNPGGGGGCFIQLLEDKRNGSLASAEVMPFH